MDIIAELRITPVGVGVSFSRYIAECERILTAENIKVRLHAEGTDIEGEFDDVMRAVKLCITALHDMGVPRLMLDLHISSRTDKLQTMEDKIQSVEAQL
jgi:uncharacterized protein (TIGR00106 family)